MDRDRHPLRVGHEQHVLDELRSLARNDPGAVESFLRSEGIVQFAGVDEAGRGPIAGPVVTCACIVPADFFLDGLTDSKQLNEKQLDAMYLALLQYPGVECSIAVIDCETIDSINILQATLLGMSQSIARLKTCPSLALIDGNFVPSSNVPCCPVIKGDFWCASISAASVIAKVTRDRMLLEYETLWPQYGFARHKGYGTSDHLRRLRLYGPCPIHRKSFAPVRELLGPKQLSFAFVENALQGKALPEP